MYARSSVRRASAALSILALCSLSHAASAQTAAFYTIGTYTVDAAHSVTVNAFSGYDGSSFTDNQGHPYNPTVNLVSGGSIGSYLDAYNSSTVNISGGSIGSYLLAVDTSTVTISGGTFGKANGVVNFFDATNGAFTLIGSNLTATSLGADKNQGGTNYALSGTLQGGTNLLGYVINVNVGARMFTLQNTPAAVPEPGSVALFVGLGVTGAGLLARRRAHA